MWHVPHERTSAAGSHVHSPNRQHAWPQAVLRAQHQPVATSSHTGYTSCTAPFGGHRPSPEHGHRSRIAHSTNRQPQAIAMRGRRPLIARAAVADCQRLHSSHRRPLAQRGDYIAATGRHAHRAVQPGQDTLAQLGFTSQPQADTLTEWFAAHPPHTCSWALLAAD